MTLITYSYLAVGISLLFWFGFLWLTREICFMSNDTDDEHQVRAASQSHKWHWLSDMHKSGTIKTNTKDGMVLLLVLFQKIFRNNDSERPLMALYGFSVAMSGLLIFFIGNNYWGPLIGFWLMILYLLSAWPWQTALYGGHVCVSTMAFLASILTIQQISAGTPSFLLLMIAGTFFCFMAFSSGSSIKYIPLVFVSIFVSKFYTPLLEDGVATVIIKHLAEIDYKADISVLMGLAILFIFLKIAKKYVVNLLYDNKSFLIKQLNIIQGQRLFSREYYYKHFERKLSKYFKNLIIAYIGLSAIVHFIGSSYLLPFFAGFILLFLIFTLPNIKINTKNYLRHILSPARKTRFEKYVEYFAKRGMNIGRDFRSPLFHWLTRVSWRVAPIQTLLLISLFLITFIYRTDMTSKILVLLASSLPVILGELTRSTRSLRTYSPSLMGIFLFLGYASASLNWPHVWIYLIVATAIIGLHQFWLFFTDIYPARIAISNLIKELAKYNILEFYTYKTSYNNSFVDALKKKYIIHYINSIDDIKKGWIIIPPTNSRSPYMEGDPEALDGDYTKDPKLNELLTTRKIDKIATAKFKTLGSSKIWPQEADVATYMDLILKEVGENERFRGYAWLVNAENIDK